PGPATWGSLHKGDDLVHFGDMLTPLPVTALDPRLEIYHVHFQYVCTTNILSSATTDKMDSCETPISSSCCGCRLGVPFCCDDNKLTFTNHIHTFSQPSPHRVVASLFLMDRAVADPAPFQVAWVGDVI